MSNDIPADIIQAVSVVPMLAPMMTEMACASVSNPALTNETVITVVAVDDCTEAVTSIPVSIPVKRLVVIAPKTWRNWGPAIFCRASLIDFIPNMRRANEPKSLKMIVMDIFNERFDGLLLQSYKKTRETQKKCKRNARIICIIPLLFVPLTAKRYITLWKRQLR